jgi:hypothetical protein
MMLGMAYLSMSCPMGAVAKGFFVSVTFIQLSLLVEFFTCQ